MRRKDYLPVAWAMLLLGAMLGSCVPEDESDNLLVGVWQFVSEEGYEVVNGKTNEWQFDFDYVMTYSFYSDGSFKLHDAKNNDTDRGVYSLRRDQLTLTFEYDEGAPETHTVRKLTSTELILEYREQDGSFYLKNWLERVN